MTRLRLLGRLQIEASPQQPVRLARKAQGLLACVAVSAGDGTPRARLLGLLWPDLGEREARGALRQCLHLLRQSLGPSAALIENDADRLVLRPQACEVDLHRFEALAAGDGLESLLAAADLYRGEFVEGLDCGTEFAAWSAMERERLRGLAQAVLARLAEAAAAPAAIEHAVRLALRLQAADPLHEGSHRALMRLYARAGQRAKAAEAWTACRQLLRRELGVEPSAATAAVAAQVCGEAANGSTPAAMPSPPLGPTPALPALHLRHDPRVVDLLLRGWELFAAFTPASNRQARACFERAMHLAGDDALATARLGWTYWIESLVGWSSDPEASMQQAHRLAVRAMAFNRDQHPTPHSLMGKVLLWRGQHDAALEQLQRAVALQPGYAYAHFHLAEAYMWCGRCAEALEAVERALALDPNDHGMFLTIRGLALWMLEEHDAATSALQSAITRNPGYPWSRLGLAAVLVEQGRVRPARTEAAAARRRNPRMSIAFIESGMPFRQPGHRRRMAEALRAAGLPQQEGPPVHAEAAPPALQD